MAQIKNDNIGVRAPKPIDEREGFWLGDVWKLFSTPQEALADEDVIRYRYPSMTIPIDDGFDQVEYWFVGGLADENFVLKTSQGGVTTKGTIDFGDPILEIDWATDTVPDETITWEAKHGDLSEVIIQTSRPDPVYPGFNSATLDWKKNIPDSKVIIDNGGDECDYLFFSKVPLSTPTPTGRVFIVGNGVELEDFVLDADDVDAPWYPLQPNDTFKFREGQYWSIKFINITTDTGNIFIENEAGLITILYYIELIWDVKMENVVIDFTKGTEPDYGLLLSPDSSYFGNKITFDKNEVGNFNNCTIKGIHTYNAKDKGWENMSSALPYDNGVGTKSISGLTIEDCKWSSDIEDGSYGVNFGGEILGPDGMGFEGIDNGYVENVIMRRLVIEGGTYDFRAGNINNYLVQDITPTGVNPTSTIHSRIFDFFGYGIAERIKGVECYGDLFRLVPFNRGDTKLTSIIRNVIGYRSRKYSCVEINQFESEQREWPGVATWSNVKVLGVTGVDMGTMEGDPAPSPYTSTCVDIFGGDLDGAGVTIKDCVAINPFMNGGPTLMAINGPVETESNNVAYADNTEAKLVDYVAFIPASDSPLKGAGILDSDLATDFYETTRINPPTIGAVEAL